jgi:hypothetical protein
VQNLQTTSKGRAYNPLFELHRGANDKEIARAPTEEARRAMIEEMPGQFDPKRDDEIFMGNGRMTLSSTGKIVEEAMAENAEYGTAFHCGVPGSFCMDPGIPMSKRPSIAEIAAVVSFTYPATDGDWYMAAVGPTLASNFNMDDVAPNTLFFGLAAPGSSKYVGCDALYSKLPTGEFMCAPGKNCYLNPQCQIIFVWMKVPNLQANDPLLLKHVMDLTGTTRILKMEDIPDSVKDTEHKKIKQDEFAKKYKGHVLAWINFDQEGIPVEEKS